MKAGQPLAEMDSSILRAQLDQQVALAAEQKANADRAREGGRAGARPRQPGRHRRGAAAAALLCGHQRPGQRHRADGLGEGDADTAGAHGRARAGLRPGDPAQRQSRRHLRRRGAAVVRDGRGRPDRAQRRRRRSRLRQDAPGRARQGDAGRRRDGRRRGAAGQPARRLHQPTRQGADQPAGAPRHPLRRLRPRQLHRPHPRRAGAARDRHPLRRQRRLGDGGAAPTASVAQVPVRTGDRGGGYVELLSGPPVGSVVVAKAASQLLPGDFVKPDWSDKPPGS